MSQYFDEQGTTETIQNYHASTKLILFKIVVNC